MKYFILGVIPFLLSCGISNSTVSGDSSQTSKMTTLICDLNKCTDRETLYIYGFNGIGMEELYSAGHDSDHVFTFQLPSDVRRFYYVGFEPGKAQPIIVGTEDTVQLTAECESIRASKFDLASVNHYYKNVKGKLSKFDYETQQLNKMYRKNMRNKEGLKKVISKNLELDNQKIEYIDSINKVDPFIGKVVALKTYVSYESQKEKAPTELEYFRDFFFQYVDLTDDELDQMPALYEGFRTYANGLYKSQLSDESKRKAMMINLNKLEVGTPAAKFALGGIISALSKMKHGDYVHFADMYISDFGEKHPKVATYLKGQSRRIQASVPGSMAPDFTMKSHDGTDVSLSDFKGKLVLIDFWASWCGPCRKENPNVVRLYNKYKDKGFEILGVSLDKDKRRWVSAIEKDGLTWVHVSDLKGWGNVVAKDYLVSSIPHTVLVGRDGKIIARNLRGDALHRKVSSLLDAE